MKHRIVMAVAALAFIAACLCGCAHDGQLSLPAAGWEPTTYYLFPGEPAPVEGYQLPSADYLRLLDCITALKKQIADLVAETAGAE